MKSNFFLLLVLAFFSFLTATAQTKKQYKIDSTTRVTDSTGEIILPYSVWRDLKATYRYEFKLADSLNLDKGFLLIKLSDEEYNKRQKNAAKPYESKYFKTGSEFMSFRDKDLEGNRFSLKKLKGKIVVMNFWFVKCSPCRMEIPNLNELVKKYEKDSSIVFLAFCLDDSSTVKEFLKDHPFNYHQLTDMRYLTSTLKISGFPTHVVLDKEGKIVFHTSGYGLGTIPWIDRAIEVELDN